MATNAPRGVGLTTEVDRELSGLKSGIESGKVGARQSGVTGTMDEAARDRETSPGSVEYRHFCTRHPDWDGEHWEECRAFYAGGPALLRNPDVLDRVFPSHNAEAGEVYEERRARAFYFAYPGTIVDNIVEGMGEDPITVTPEATGDREKDEVAKLDEEFSEFLDDVSIESSDPMPAHALILETVREALITKTGWVLLDLPEAPQLTEENGVKSKLDQERQGLLKPYACVVESEFVTNWQCDRDGALEWAVVMDCELRQESFASEPMIVETYTIYDRVGWVRYQIAYEPGKPPKPTDPVELVSDGAHPFERVPLVRLQLPEGLWAMGKLESLAREHFNKRCAVSWAEYKSLFSVLTMFLAPEQGSEMKPNVSQAQQNPNRGVDQVRGQGYTTVLGADDRAEYVGPDTAPFKEGRESCNDIMREMHRVLFSMSLSANMDQAALRRSGESKRSDDEKIAVILKALGYYAKRLLREIIKLWEVAKSKEVNARVGGGEEYTGQDVMEAITLAVEALNGIPIKSPTFKKAYLLKLYKLIMGDGLTQDEWADVRKELDEMITMEGEMLDDPVVLAREMAKVESGDDDDEDEDDDPPPSNGKPRRMGGTMRSG